MKLKKMKFNLYIYKSMLASPTSVASGSKDLSIEEIRSLKQSIRECKLHAYGSQFGLKGKGAFGAFLKVSSKVMKKDEIIRWGLVTRVPLSLKHGDDILKVSSLTGSDFTELIAKASEFAEQYERHQISGVVCKLDINSDLLKKLIKLNESGVCAYDVYSDDSIQTPFDRTYIPLLQLFSLLTPDDIRFFTNADGNTLEKETGRDETDRLRLKGLLNRVTGSPHWRVAYDIKNYLSRFKFYGDVSSLLSLLSPDNDITVMIVIRPSCASTLAASILRSSIISMGEVTAADTAGFNINSPEGQLPGDIIDYRLVLSYLSKLETGVIERATAKVKAGVKKFVKGLKSGGYTTRRKKRRVTRRTKRRVTRRKNHKIKRTNRKIKRTKRKIKRTKRKGYKNKSNK